LTTWVDSDSGTTWTQTSRAGTKLAWADSFGEWRRGPALVSGVRVSTHHLALAHRFASGGDGFGAPSALSTAPLGWLQSETGDLWVDWFFYWPFYFGGELQMGGSTARQPATLSARPHVGVAGGSVIGAGTLVGAATPRLGRFSARAEVYVGGLSHSLSTDAATTPLPDSCDSDGCPGELGVDTWVVEPRVSLSFWLSPWFTLDAYGGANLVTLGDWSTGLGLTFHARSYDGGKPDST
jgi:hypothetical protein